VQSMPMTRGAAFKMSFTKHRGLRPDPATLHLELGEDEDQWFEWFMTKPGASRNG